MKNHLLSIGISEYQAYSNLNFAHRDALDFHELFKRNIPDLGYEKRLVNNEATYSQMRDALGQELQDAVGKDDVAFIFFSGHGAAPEMGSEAVHALVPYDATSDLVATGLPVTFLKDQLDKLKAKQIYVFIDSCFSGAVTAPKEGMTGKSIAGRRSKEVKSVRSIDTLGGSGRVVFTACKDNEEAWEDPALGHGVFTDALLKELQKKRAVDEFPITDIFHPVAERVMTWAKAEGASMQTPNQSVYTEGLVTIPVFKKPLSVTPSVLEPPSFPEITDEPIPFPTLDISDDKLKTVAGQITKMLLREGDERITNLYFARYCKQVVSELEMVWNERFQEDSHTRNPEFITDSVSYIEGHALTLVLTGQLVATYGTPLQQRIYSDEVLRIHGWTKGRNGLTALIQVPDVLLLVVAYSFALVGIDTRNFSALDNLMRSRIYDPHQHDDARQFGEFYQVHYIDALGRDARKVFQHILELFSNLPTLQEVTPGFPENPLTSLLQANFVLGLIHANYDEPPYPTYGHYDGERIKPLTERIKFDSALQESLGKALSIPAEKVREHTMAYVRAMQKIRLGGMGFWDSIGYQDLMTNDERREAWRKNEI